MPVQTTQKSNVYYPDGAKVQMKALGDPGFTDVGVITSTITNTLEWTESQINTANAGELDKKISAMQLSGGFTLGNLNPLALEKFSGGVFELVETAGVPVTTIPDQIIPANWDDNIVYDLGILTSPTDNTPLRIPVKPTITSITLDVGGAGEPLTEGDDYVIVAANSYSGWGITFISAGMVTASPKTLAITIVYGTNTPVAKTSLYAGSSSVVLTPVEVQIVHTDGNGKQRGIILPSVETGTGSFQFNWKGANEDGIEEMPLTYTAKLDTSKADGRQLLEWFIENGAL